MANNLVIAQVTDMHIGPSNVSFRGINVREQFLKVLKVLAKKPLDLVVFSGDLAASEGEPEAYTWIKSILDDFPHPYRIMAGNHDHVIRMRRVFDLPENEHSSSMLFFAETIKGKRLLFLDSSRYRITKPQIEWLMDELAKNKKPVLIFIHHPPLLCGCQFMDEHHALQSPDELWQILEQSPVVEHIFCGHYHVEKKVEINGNVVHLTPSTVFQIEPDNPQFAIAHTKPGWRIIEFKTTQVRTRVEYL
jgi:3',5'-cyclic-AMP phosphodiesterase